MASTSGEQTIATILKFDNKATSYKIALLRSINDVVLMYPDVAKHGQSVAVPLNRLAELWIAYYWPFADEQKPVYQGARAKRGESVRNDMAFRPALTKLRNQWQELVQFSPQPADGFFLLTEMRTPRRRATYAPALVQSYQKTVSSIVKQAIPKPIEYAGPGHWLVFDAPVAYSHISSSVLPLPGTQPHDICVVVPAYLWEAFHRLSLYVEALCLHEWCMFTEAVEQEANRVVSRGEVYALLTSRPDNRCSLQWERNQINILLHEQVAFRCPWTGQPITHRDQYDLDHLLPLAIYPINELWNLLPVKKEFNQVTKRDRIPDRTMLLASEARVSAAYSTYQKSAKLSAAMHEDAHLRFATLLPGPDFANSLAHQAIEFIDSVATSRYARRFNA